MDVDTAVKVAVRIRPQNSREQIDMCRVCTFCTPGQSQIVLGKDKAFTYDCVFDTGTLQDVIYEDCVEELISGCLEGYNATILAYGQTGSGKTYTMGTGFGMAMTPEEEGVIPRAVAHIFSTTSNRRTEALEKGETPPEFEITAQFMELYNEEIIDLFGEQGRKLRIHEDHTSSIYVAGATEQKVESEEDTLSCLKQGALSRSVGSTNMNAQSSRSHAIFTLHINQRRPCKSPTPTSTEEGAGSKQTEESDWESLTAKLHFVDLAGSERLKRTGATGDRAKEGISINCGLLALGNVISALGDKAKRGSHVPYRDSKLTRLLQDSLGGNSKTLMIACISPTDRDFMETLNTLKYSNRARNIKNKVVLNQDKSSLQLSILRSRIQELELELQEFKSGRIVVNEDGSVAVNDMATEITMLRTENDKLRIHIKSLQQVIDSQSTKIASLMTEREMAALGRADESTGQVVGQESRGETREQGLSTVIQGYMKQIEELQGRLVLSESLAQQSPRSPFRRAPSTLQRGASRGMLSGRTGSVSAAPLEQQTDDLLNVARNNIQRLREQEERKGSESDLRVSPPRNKTRKSDDAPTEDGQKSSVAFGSEEDTSNEESDDDSDDMMTCPFSDDSDSDDDETESLASSIAELSSEINLKQQLVDQLEKSQKSFHMMRGQYEEKVQLLQQQIRSIETERDKVLKDMGSQRGENGQQRAKEVKGQYERQLKELKAELKQLKTVKKEHARAMKKNAEQDRQLKLINSQLHDMKKQRVKMMNKMRQEANMKKVEDGRKAKEMGQLRKEARKRENQIKSLQSDARRREVVLKRRQEEVTVLRRKNRHQSNSSGLSTASGSSLLGKVPPEPRTTSLSVLSSSTSETSYSATVVLRQQEQRGGSGIHDRLRRRMSSVFSSDSARKKWRNFERKILDAVLKRQTMTSISADMDNWIEKRDQLSRKVEDLRKQRKIALAAKKVDGSVVASIEEDLDSISANIEYVQENIVELQNDLIALDDSKTDGDTMEAHAIINSCSPRESKYLLEHVLDMVLNLGVKAAQKETEVKSLQARLKASEQSAEIIKSFSSPQVTGIPVPGTVTKMKHKKFNSPPPVLKYDLTEHPSNPPTHSQSMSTLLERPTDKETKLRRRTALPSELVAITQPSVSSGERQRQFTDPPSRGGKDGDNTDGSEGNEAGVTFRVRRGSAGPFDAKRKGLKKRSETALSLDVSEASCPNSAGTSHKPIRSAASETNVWARLAHSTAHDVSDSKGSLQVEKQDPRRNSTRLLTCTHTASGHSSAVLSLFATQSYLFSASQDRTVKVWNLKTGTELLALDKHFGYVRSVTYCPRTSLIFTASQSLIKIWDMRHHRARCIKTFGPPSGAGGSDSVVQELLVSPCGNTLYSATGNAVNMWDLKRFMYRGRLVGHNGAVSALTMKGNIMASGARDRLIKLFDLESIDTSSSPVSQPSMCTLYPPHYDAVSSFGVYNNLLFSSCGVTIKQWDLSERCLKQAVDGAHPQGNMINSLATLPSPITPLLVSGCKGGLLKLWNPDNCNSIGEVAAHKSSINSIVTNDTCIFTGSSDKTIRIWRPCLLQD